MISISEAVQAVNEALKATAFKDIAGLRMVGITEGVPYKSDDSKPVVFLPSVVSEDGEAEQIILDDTYPLTIYHRLTVKNPTLNKMQAGDSNINVTDRYNMTMIVIGDRVKLKQSQIAIEQKISQMFPDQVKEGQKVRANFTLSPTDFDTKRIWDGEYPNIEYAGFPDVFMLKIDYQVSITYRRLCRDVCKCD